MLWWNNDKWFANEINMEDKNVKKGKLNQNPLRQQTCLRIGDFSFFAKGELGLRV